MRNDVKTQEECHLQAKGLLRLPEARRETWKILFTPLRRNRLCWHLDHGLPWPPGWEWLNQNSLHPGLCSIFAAAMRNWHISQNFKKYTYQTPVLDILKQLKNMHFSSFARGWDAVFENHCSGHLVDVGRENSLQFIVLHLHSLADTPG